MSPTESSEHSTNYRILFVCSGNTCRSPLAEAITRSKLAERGWTYVEVDSAGTGAGWDIPASQGALDAAAAVGLDLSGHRSQPLTEETVRRADIILAMTPTHSHHVEALGGETKVSLLSEFEDGPEAGTPIEDPIGGTSEDYARARDRIEGAVERLLDHLEAILAP